MSKETSIRLQPRTGRNESIPVRPLIRLKLGIYKRVMNWCGRNQLATAIIVILFVLILSQLLLLFIVQAHHESEMQKMKRQIETRDLIRHMWFREGVHRGN